MRRLGLLLALCLALPALASCAGRAADGDRLAQASPSAPRSQAEFILWNETRRQRLDREFTYCEEVLADEGYPLGSDSELAIQRGRLLLGQLRALLWRASQATPEEFEGLRWQIQSVLADIDRALAGAC